jgi:serine/threonine protein kinase
MTGCNGAGGGTDESLAAVLDGYLADVEAGRAPPRAEMLARHPALADGLRECLDALDLIRRGAGAAAPPGPRAEGHEPDPPGVAPGTLGDFRIVREVGRGGMGVVYEAEQVSLGRKVALKVLPLVGALNANQLQRFHNEARAAASLHHEHIVPVYAVGCERGTHFYAMQLVEGLSLAQFIHRQKAGAAGPASAAEPTAAYAPPGPQAAAETAAGAQTARSRHDRAYYEQVARLGAEAAEALEYAHSVGVVHRDVKPANLLVDARGKLWVADFGLARLGGPQAGLTATGDVLGTLRYASPEQAQAKHNLVDHRTDVYALGPPSTSCSPCGPPSRARALPRSSPAWPTTIRRRRGG